MNGSLESLEVALESFSEPRVSELQSAEGVARRLVRIYSDSGRFRGHGLMLTEDGFIVTASHVVESLSRYQAFGEDFWREEGHIRSWQGLYAACHYGTFAIDPSYFYGKRQVDLALIKAESNGPPVPADFNLSAQELKMGDAVKAHATVKGSRKTLKGVVLFERTGGMVSTLVEGGVLWNKVYDCVSTSISSNPGFSGSPLLDSEGAVAGLASHMGRISGSDISNYAYFSAYAKTKNILRLMAEAVG